MVTSQRQMGQMEQMGRRSPWWQRPWGHWFADVLWLALVSGPLAAPYLAASGLWPLETIAQIIYAMGVRVCPQPELGLALAPPHIMAVCMRCYGTVLGLVLMRFLYLRDRGCSGYWLPHDRWWGFAIAFPLCLVYPAELALQGFAWWPVNNGLMTLFGWIAGVGLGSYLMPWIYGED